VTLCTVYSSSMFMVRQIRRCFRFRRSIKHYHINQREDELSPTGRRYFLYDDDFHAPTIHVLLRHYTTHPIPLAPQSQPVGLPVDKNDWATTELKLSKAILDRWIYAIAHLQSETEKKTAETQTIAYNWEFHPQLMIRVPETPCRKRHQLSHLKTRKKSQSWPHHLNCHPFNRTDEINSSMFCFYLP